MSRNGQLEQDKLKLLASLRRLNFTCLRLAAIENFIRRQEIKVGLNH